MTQNKQYLHKKTRGLTTPPSLEVCATTTDPRNATDSEKLQCFLRQLAPDAPLTALCCISTLEMPRCEMKELNTESLAGVLTQCPALTLLNIRKGADRSESLAGVLGQCTVLGGSKFVRRRPNFEAASLRASSHKRAL
jgi:hypothetical protein